MKCAIVGVLACGLSLAACGPNNESDAGDGGGMETGPADTGTPDVGGGGDTGTPDTGTPDMGAPDAGTPDASMGDGGGGDGSGGDGGGGFMAIAPCNTADSYMTGPTAVMISGLSYSPACLTVHAGTTVTLPGTTFHPLASRPGGSPSNPIPSTGTTMPAMVNFTTPGFYPYRCTVHEAVGMIGVVQVIP